MDGLKNTLSFVFFGLKDCLLGVLALRHFLSQSSNTRPRRRHLSENPKSLFGVLKQCFIFGILVWAGIFIFNHGVLNHCITYLESYLEPEEREAITWFPSFLSFVFFLLWTLPLFVLSKILNYWWYQQVADMTFETTGGKKRPASSISYEKGDQIESGVVQFVFMLQGYAMLLLPLPDLIKQMFLTLHLSLLYALYSFEYKWVQMGWGLRKRLAYINSKWPYFFGFGLPLAIISSYVGSYIESICIFSTLFPIYVVSSTVTIDSRVQQYSLPIKFFWPASMLTNFFCVLICSLLFRQR